MVSPCQPSLLLQLNRTGLLRRDWCDVRGYSCCIIAITIAARFRLQQFGAHMTGAFAALWGTAMKTENFCRTRSTAFFGGTADVFFP